MKYLKEEDKKKRKKRLVTVLIVAPVLLVAAAAAVLLPPWLAERDQQMQTPGQTEASVQTDAAEPTEGTESIGQTEPDGTTEPTEYMAPLQELEVVTDYGTFLLSGHWDGEVRAETAQKDGYTISVFGRVGAQREQRAFDVYFGGTAGDHVGYVMAPDGGAVEVTVLIYDLESDESWTETEKLEFLGMQGEVNSIIGQLRLLSDEEVRQNVNTETVSVETRYLPLSYPAAWKDQVRTVVIGGDTVVVSFYGTLTDVGEHHLFDIVLAGEGEEILGFYTADDGTEISVEVANVAEGSADGWPEQAMLEMSAMMEMINNILQNLEETGRFVYF